MNAPVAVPPAAYAARVKTVRSPGGIEAWLVEDYTVPLIALHFAVQGGAAQDPPGKPGLAYFLSGLLDEGAGPYDSQAFHERLDDYAVELRFEADRDQLVGRLRTLARHRDEGFEMLGLALTAPRFDAEPIDRVRAQIEAGLRHESTDPDNMANRAWFTAAFPDHAYGRPVKGTLESLPHISRDDLGRYRERIIARDSLKIAVVGAIDAASLGKELDRLFGGLPAKSERAAVPDMEPAGLGACQIADLDIPQTSIRFGRPGIDRNDPDWIAATVVNHIYGGGAFSSRLFQEVREKRGLAYSVYSHLLPLDHAPLLIGGTSTKNERAFESLDVIAREMAALIGEGPTPEELDKAKKYQIGSYALRFDTSTKMASQLVQLQMDGLGADYMDRRNGLVAAVTLEDARRVARRLFGDGELLVTMAGRPEER